MPRYPDRADRIRNPHRPNRSRTPESERTRERVFSRKEAFLKVAWIIENYPDQHIPDRWFAADPEVHLRGTEERPGWVDLFMELGLEQSEHQFLCTGACIAGWLCLLAGEDPLWKKGVWAFRLTDRVTNTSEAFEHGRGVDESAYPDEYAGAFYNIHETAAERLFYSTRFSDALFVHILRELSKVGDSRKIWPRHLEKIGLLYVNEFRDPSTGELQNY